MRKRGAMQIVRQGDVMLELVDEIPAKADAVKPSGGLVVLARGEASGHVHAFNARSAMLQRVGAVLYVTLARAALLKHGNPEQDWKGDHETKRVPPGKYRVIIERDYLPGSWATVID